MQPEGHPFAPEADFTRLALHHYVLKSRAGEHWLRNTSAECCSSRLLCNGRSGGEGANKAGKHD